MRQLNKTIISLQELLLTQLGINPLSGDNWPLTIHGRTLAVLAEILLLKQQREREAKLMKSDSETAIINIWVRFLDTLKTAIFNPAIQTDSMEGNLSDFLMPKQQIQHIKLSNNYVVNSGLCRYIFSI